MPHPVRVFITVDTEVWPRYPDWREDKLAKDMRRDIYGVTPRGKFGLPFQIQVLNQHGLKAVFFVEGLFASAAGLDPLREIVTLVQEGGHEVQPHLHTEWLAWMREPILPGKRGQNLADFSEDEQALLIGKASENLRACGVAAIRAFRAGNYGADLRTLPALRRNGISFDSSYNFTYHHRGRGIPNSGMILQPKLVDGVCELPISFFRDGWGRYRHAQLCACSASEMRNALLQAWEQQWYSFVLVSHSFEMIRRRKQTKKPARSDGIVIRRFHQLCQFLEDNGDKFRTTTFAEIAPEAIPPQSQAQPLTAGMFPTTARWMEQLARRVF